MCLLQAKRLIALSWKNVQRPQVGQWLREMTNCCTMETVDKITYILKGKSETFDRVWGPFTQLLGNVNVLDMLRSDDNGNL